MRNSNQTNEPTYCFKNIITVWVKRVLELLFKKNIESWWNTTNSMPSGNQVENDRIMQREIMQRKTENANLVCIAHL